MRMSGVLLTGALLAACGSGAVVVSTTEASPVAPTTTATVLPVTTIPETEQGQTINSIPEGVATGLEASVDAAVADLAERQAVTPEEVEVLGAELVTWSDASLGCPQPDMQYLQVLTDGARIVLQLDDETYAYHMGGDVFEPFLCEQPVTSAGDSSSSGSDPLEGTNLELDKPVEKYPDETVPPPGYDK